MFFIYTIVHVLSSVHRASKNLGPESSVRDKQVKAMERSMCEGPGQAHMIQHVERPARRLEG